jgi:hypothetical protein
MGDFTKYQIFVYLSIVVGVLVAVFNPTVQSWFLSHFPVLVLIALIIVHYALPMVFMWAAAATYVGSMVWLNQQMPSHQLAMALGCILPVVAAPFLLEKTDSPELEIGGLVVYTVVLLAVTGSYIQEPHAAILGAMTFFAIIAIFLNKFVFKSPIVSYLSDVLFLLVCAAAFAGLSVYTFNTAARVGQSETAFQFTGVLLFFILVGAIVWLVTVFSVKPDYFSTTNFVLKWIVAAACMARDFVTITLRQEKRTSWIILFLEILFIVFYFHQSQLNEVRTKGGNGTTVVADPVKLNKATSYNLDNYNYNYAISFWVYLNPQPPEQTPLATSYVNLLSKGDAPSVMYNAAENNIRMSVVDASGDRILIDDIPRVPLQTWNNFILICNQSSFDVFLNGKLRKSIHVIPNIDPATLVLGEDGGARGKICTVMVFRGVTNEKEANFDPVTTQKILALYNDFKTKDPPVF